MKIHRQVVDASREHLCIFQQNREIGHWLVATVSTARKAEGETVDCRQ